MDRRKKPKWQIDIANARIDILMKLAEKEALRGREDLANRYVDIARKIAEKFNIRIGGKYGKRFCRKCNTFFTSRTLEVRLNKRLKHVEYRCKKCGYVRRYPYLQSEDRHT